MDNDYWAAYAAVDCIVESELIAEEDDYVVISIPRSLWDSYQELANGN